MMALIKIAVRNILMNRKRSLLIGIAIFFSSFLLFFSDAMMNGVEKQMMRGYLNFQTGNVAVIWEDLKKVSNMDLGRFINPVESISFNFEKDALNKRAIARLNEFISKNRAEIKEIFPTVRRAGQFYAGNKTDTMVVYGLTPENKDFLLNENTLKLKEGELVSQDDYSICISKEKAGQNDLKCGDMITVEVTTPYGAKNSLDFIIRGIYENTAGYDNLYGFISDKNARELYDFDPEYFDIVRIYLKNPAKALEFAKRLDQYLTAESMVLRAESSAEASPFYTNQSQNMKALFNFFILFLLAIIAIGLRSTVRMNLFERMKEFGTIRAIGYSRFQSYVIIFSEIFVLSLVALLAALVICGILVLITGFSGIYVGPGPISYALAGESFYPRMNIVDVFLAFIIIIIFALIATLNPGLRLCYQSIPDLMNKRQKRVLPLIILFKKLFRLKVPSETVTSKC